MQILRSLILGEITKLKLKLFYVISIEFAEVALVRALTSRCSAGDLKR